MIRLLGDFDLAEEALHEAFSVALERWPQDGLPDNPRAWLISTGRFKAIDRLRRQARFTPLSQAQADALEAAEWSVEDVEDDRLRLIFTCCHPALAPDAQAALTLREICDLTTEEIARAFLSTPTTIAQRIVRAKRLLAKKQVPFEVPRKSQLDERLDSVLEVIYLVFNEGYSATTGDDWMRPALCDEALRLGRQLAGLMPGETEVLGLLALIELQASRTKARMDGRGNPVLLLEQNRARWDHLQIARGLAALERASGLGGAQQPYALQAAIAACHARARQAADTDWVRIAALYAALANVMPSPVVELNRAVAQGMAYGPEAGLALVETLANDPALRDYASLPAVRGDLLQKLGRHEEARAEFERAAGLTLNARTRALMLARALACH